MMSHLSFIRNDSFNLNNKLINILWTIRFIDYPHKNRYPYPNISFGSFTPSKRVILERDKFFYLHFQSKGRLRVFIEKLIHLKLSPDPGINITFPVYKSADGLNYSNSTKE